MRNKGYTGGVVPPATFADGGIPQTSEKLNERIATIMVRAKLQGRVTDDMKAELKVLGDQLRKQEGHKSRRSRRR